MSARSWILVSSEDGVREYVSVGGEILRVAFPHLAKPRARAGERGLGPGTGDRERLAELVARKPLPGMKEQDLAVALGQRGM